MSNRSGMVVRDRAARARRAPALWLWLALPALLAGGCGTSTTDPAPQPVTARLVGFSGRTVTWTTDQPTRGAVRYGFVSGQPDRLAYPAAAGGADKSYTTAHSVPLLSVPEAGATVYLQFADATADGRLYVAAEETLAFGPLPAAGPCLAFTTFDVQFGDAHLLRLPTASATVAIDGGNPYEGANGESAPRHVMRWLDDRGITRLDVALATHMHADHVGGLLNGTGGDGQGLLARYEIGLYLDVAAVSGNQYNQTAVRNLMASRSVPVLTIAPGMDKTTAPAALGWDPLVDVMVLNAGAQAEWAGGDLNNDSVVLKVSYGDVDLITGGDCLVAGEERILSLYRGALDNVEYFKASHHGRANANSQPYLLAIAPRVAIIPVAFVAYSEGPDQGALDTAQTLGRLADLRADVFRFDAAEPLARPQDNRTFWHTTFVTDGASYEIRIEPSVWGL